MVSTVQDERTARQASIATLVQSIDDMQDAIDSAEQVIDGALAQVATLSTNVAQIQAVVDGLVDQDHLVYVCQVTRVTSSGVVAVLTPTLTSEWRNVGSFYTGSGFSAKTIHQVKHDMFVEQITRNVFTEEFNFVGFTNNANYPTSGFGFTFKPSLIGPIAYLLSGGTYYDMTWTDWCNALNPVISIELELLFFFTDAYVWLTFTATVHSLNQGSRVFGGSYNRAFTTGSWLTYLCRQRDQLRLATIACDAYVPRYWLSTKPAEAGGFQPGLPLSPYNGQGLPN